MRPPALMRGPSRKPRCQDSGGPLSRAASISAVSPICSRRRSAISPLATKARLSPFSGTTSATVPSATRCSIDNKIRRRPRGAPETALAQFARQRHQRQEHQSDGGEMAEPGQIVGAVRIDDGGGVGKLLVGLVMIDDHRLQPELARFGERFMAGGAAIDRDQQRRAALREGADGVDVRPVALEDPVGNMHDRIEPAVPQVAAQQRRRGRAVDIVVAEDRDASRP